MDSLSVSKKQRKIMCMADDDKLDEALFLWFVQKRSQEMPISGPLLCEKAVLLNSGLSHAFSNTCLMACVEGPLITLSATNIIPTSLL